MTDDSTGNFAFLRAHDACLAGIGAQAERYFADDPPGTLVKLRLLAELLAQEVAARLGLPLDPASGQSDLLGRLRRSGTCPPRALELFHFVRDAGNRAVHENKGDHGTALSALKAARELAVWFYRSFGGARGFKPGPFRPPQPPQPRVASGNRAASFMAILSSGFAVSMGTGS